MYIMTCRGRWIINRMHEQIAFLSDTIDFSHDECPLCRSMKKIVELENDLLGARADSVLGLTPRFLLSKEVVK